MDRNINMVIFIWIGPTQIADFSWDNTLQIIQRREKKGLAFLKERKYSFQGDHVSSATSFWEKFHYNLYFASKMETKENFLVFASFRNPNVVLYHSLSQSTLLKRSSNISTILLSTLKVKHKRTEDTKSLALRDCWTTRNTAIWFPNKHQSQPFPAVLTVIGHNNFHLQRCTVNPSFILWSQSRYAQSLLPLQPVQGWKTVKILYVHIILMVFPNSFDS